LSAWATYPLILKEGDKLLNDNFEQEVLQRLSIIETEVKSYNDNKKQIYENQRNILLIQNSLDNIKNTNNKLVGAVITIICALTVYILKYILKI